MIIVLLALLCVTVGVTALAMCRNAALCDVAAREMFPREAAAAPPYEASTAVADAPRQAA